MFQPILHEFAEGDKKEYDQIKAWYPKVCSWIMDPRWEWDGTKRHAYKIMKNYPAGLPLYIMLDKYGYIGPTS